MSFIDQEERLLSLMKSDAFRIKKDIRYGQVGNHTSRIACSRVDLTCAHCGANFSVAPSEALRSRKFCSRVCSGKASSISRSKAKRNG